MARAKKITKAKEPVKLWFKALRNGNKAIYLRSYVANTGGKSYKYENLGMYLVPEVDAATKNQNKNTLMAAEAIKAQRIIDTANGNAGIKVTTKGDKILLVDWMKLYIDKKLEKGQSASNARGAKCTLQHLIKYKGDKILLSQIDKAYCLGFIKYLTNGMTIGVGTPTKKGEHRVRPMSGGTAKKYFTTFASALNYAVREELIDKNPTTLIDKDDKKSLKKNSEKICFLEIEEIKKMTIAPCCNEIVKMGFLFACFTGLRFSDIITLKWSDIKYSIDGSVTVEKTQVKTRNKVIVPLSLNALKWLPERKDAKEDDFVFNMPEHSVVNKDIKKWAQEANIKKKVTFHVSRHTFAVSLLTMGADIYSVSKLLGHKKISTTEIYADIVNKKRVEIVNLIDKAL